MPHIQMLIDEVERLKPLALQSEHYQRQYKAARKALKAKRAEFVKATAAKPDGASIGDYMVDIQCAKALGRISYE